MRLSDYVNGYLDYCRYRKELDEKTIKAYKIDLHQYFSFIRDGEMKKERIESYITNLHKKFKQKTVKRKIAAVKAFYNYLEEEEIITETPFRRIKVKFKEDVVLPRIIPRGEIEALLNFMYGYLRDHAESKRDITRDVMMVEVLFATGARVCEISNIKRENMDLHSGLLRIMGKGGKERYVQICEPDILKLLREYYAQNEQKIKNSGYFFINRQGKRFSEQSIRMMLKKYTVLAGIERELTPHMFRHSFATYLIEEGVDVSCVQQLLGHSSIKTTQIYIHIAAKKQAEILREMHPRNRMKIISA